MRNTINNLIREIKIDLMQHHLFAIGRLGPDKEECPWHFLSVEGEVLARLARLAIEHTLFLPEELCSCCKYMIRLFYCVIYRGIVHFYRMCDLAFPFQCDLCQSLLKVEFESGGE